MASRAKPTGSKRNATTTKKPATIDLDAKEINKEADKKPASSSASASASATSASSKATTSPSGKAETNQNFGRPDPENSQSGTKSQASSSAKTESSDTQTKTPAREAVPENSTSKETAGNQTEKSSTVSKEPQPAPKSSGSFLGKLGYAFMGGVAALAGFGAIGIWDGARELPLIGNFYGGSSGQTEQVSTADLEALRSELANLREASSSNDAISGLTSKLETLEASVSELSGIAGDTGSLGRKISELEQNFGAVNTSIAQITAAAADGSNTSPAALSTAISALDGRMETLESGLEDVRDTITKNPVLDGINSTLGELETKVGSVSQAVESLQKSANENAQSLAGLTKQSETLESTVASVKASEKVARSVAVNALATALENDDALGLPIASVKALLGETPETSRLEALNAQGIPTGRDLQRSLSEFIATVRSPNAPPKDGSITERFWANAKSMVSFRASGPREGDDPLSILSRVEANVKDGDLQSAKAEWEKLPEEIAEKGASWLAKLNTRIEAFALQDALNQKLTAEAG